MMIKTLKHSKVLLYLIILAMLITSCKSNEPIRIRVTPTIDMTAIAEAATQVPTVIVPTSTDTEVSPTDTNVAPTDTATNIPSPTSIPATSTAIQTDGSFGPIIVPNYTPPPTSTPLPTRVPTELPTSTPIPITPITTPITNLPALDTEQLGIQLYYNVNADQWFQLLRRTDPLNVGWIKVQADWSFIQPTNSNELSGTAFSIFEAHVQRAHNDGYKVLVSIAKAPDWTRPGIANPNDPNDPDGPPANLQDMERFINLMLDRMGDQISAFELWNEPNLSREWTGGLEWSGAGYMQLFRVGYDTIRARYPDMPIITAGLAPTRAAGAIDDRLFLEQMYQAGLGDPYYQNIAVGIHPYSWGNPPDARCCDNVEGRGWDDDPRFFFMNTIEDYRNIMVNNGHENVQMWSTEFGWSSWSGLPVEAPEEWMTYTTPEQQAEYTMRAFQIGLQRDYMGPMFLWNLNFANEALIEQRNEMVGYSLFIPGLPIRPAYNNLQNSPRLE